MLQDGLFEIEEGFWSGGEDYFLSHVDERCLLAFPQMPEFRDVHSREEVAATARQPNRWRDLKISNRSMVQPADGVAILSYRAEVTRADGEPYSALIGSAYVKRGGGWKLYFHQHSVMQISLEIIRVQWLCIGRSCGAGIPVSAWHSHRTLSNRSDMR